MFFFYCGWTSRTCSLLLSAEKSFLSQHQLFLIRKYWENLRKSITFLAVLIKMSNKKAFGRIVFSEMRRYYFDVIFYVGHVGHSNVCCLQILLIFIAVHSTRFSLRHRASIHFLCNYSTLGKMLIQHLSGAIKLMFFHVLWCTK